MIPFREIFSRLKNWRACPNVPTEPRNAGIPEHLKPAPYIPRFRASNDGWTRAESVEDLAAALSPWRTPSRRTFAPQCAAKPPVFKHEERF